MTTVAAVVSIKTQIREVVSNRIIKDNPWSKNLVLNTGLNAMALNASNGISCKPAALTSVVLIGDNATAGGTPTSFPSTPTTISQAAFTATASAPFFTAAMVGMLLKYGSGGGGAEYYITAFTSSTVVTVDTSATVAASVVTVWNVSQTTLNNFLFQSSTYQTNAGDNQTTYTADTVTFKRTVTFTPQVSAYNVNEIGYAPNTTGGHIVAGRIVLGSTDVVGPTNYYVIIISLALTVSPAAPSAVVNVGTNIDTSGNAMNELFGFGTVGANGNTVSGNNDLGAGMKLAFPTATYTQQGTIPNALTLNWPSLVTVSGSASFAYLAASIGIMRVNFSAGSVGTSGQTCYGVGLIGAGDSSHPTFDIKFTTPQTLPNGTLQPNCTWQVTFGRTLVN